MYFFTFRDLKILRYRNDFFRVEFIQNDFFRVVFIQNDSFRIGSYKRIFSVSLSYKMIFQSRFHTKWFFRVTLIHNDFFQSRFHAKWFFQGHFQEWRSKHEYCTYLNCFCLPSLNLGLVPLWESKTEILWPNTVEKGESNLVLFLSWKLKTIHAVFSLNMQKFRKFSWKEVMVWCKEI